MRILWEKVHLHRKSPPAHAISQRAQVQMQSARLQQEIPSENSARTSHAEAFGREAFLLRNLCTKLLQLARSEATQWARTQQSHATMSTLSSWVWPQRQAATPRDEETQRSRRWREGSDSRASESHAMEWDFLVNKANTLQFNFKCKKNLCCREDDVFTYQK